MGMKIKKSKRAASSVAKEESFHERRHNIGLLEDDQMINDFFSASFLLIPSMFALFNNLQIYFPISISVDLIFSMFF